MIHGILAEFRNPLDLKHAAEKVRDAGYNKFDCHSPFPVHGMDQAMGLKRSKLGFVIAFFAILGGLIGFALQSWTHSIAYPLTISGKPLFAWQAYIIIIFALFVLFGAISAVLGMLHFNRLPRLHHPVFYSGNCQHCSCHKIYRWEKTVWLFGIRRFVCFYIFWISWRVWYLLFIYQSV